jgi:hypothetical protein
MRDRRELAMPDGAVDTNDQEIARQPPAPPMADTDLPPLPDAPPGRYRHYKGGEYELIGVAHHSETLEPMVVYRSLAGHGGWWVRPHALFFETVRVDGLPRPRFERLD